MRRGYAESRWPAYWWRIRLREATNAWHQWDTFGTVGPVRAFEEEPAEVCVVVREGEFSGDQETVLLMWCGFGERFGGDLPLA